MMNFFADRLHLVTALIPPGSEGAEIGVHRGEFSRQLLTTRLRKLHLVDLWAQYSAYDSDRGFNRQNHEDNFAATEAEVRSEVIAQRVEIHHGFSADVALSANLKLDWVFLDANHCYEFVLVDLVAWSLCLRRGGFIMGHDYMHRPEENYGVIPAVNEFCERFGWEMVHTTRGGRDSIETYALCKL